MHRGEIWRINLDPTIGAEIRKTRPAVIVSSDAVDILPLRVIVPVTRWKERYAAAAWMVRLGQNPAAGLEKPSCADCFQLCCVDEGRFVERLGVVSPTDLERIVQAIGLVLEIPIG